VTDYRLYLLDGAGQFVSAEWISAQSDEEAVSIARRLRKSVKSEIWQGARLVAAVAAADASEPSSGGATPDTDRLDRTPRPPEARQNRGS
jgi:hypothetical protein